MADPGFVSGLIGAVVAEILHAVIVEIGKAVKWKRYLKDLEQLLRPLEPVVVEIAAQQQTQAVREWLEEFYASLRAVNVVISKCSNVRRSDFFARHQIACELQAATTRINKFLSQSALPVLAAVVQNRASMDQSMKDLADEIKYLADQTRRIQLSMVTQKWMLSEMFDKERAFYEINSMATSSVPPAVFPQSNVADKSSPPQVLQHIPNFVFGIEEIRKRLQGILLDTPVDHVEKKPSKWVGIWGTGGIGKTLLAHMILNSLDCQVHFASKLYFLTVGRSPDVIGLQDKLSEIIGCRRKRFDSKDDGKAQLFQHLSQKKCLLVLDDVWEPDLLEWLDVVTEASGSKILVTTRNQNVLQRQNATELQVNMLSERDSWKLFCRHAFHGEENVPFDIKDVVEKVVAECKGLPLALKVTGAAMVGQTDRNGWSLVLSKLGRAVVLNKEQETQLYHRLKLSYDALEGIDDFQGRALQECFLYFAAFPEGKEIEVEQQLFEVWQGEKMIGSREEEYGDAGFDIAESEGYWLLGQLIARSLIELGDSRGWSHARSCHTFYCKIHDVLRDLAFYILQHKKELCKQKCLFRNGRIDQCNVFPEDWKEAGLRNDLSARKISLIGSCIQSLPALKIRAPEATVFLLSHNSSLTKIDNGFLQSFRKLQVLDLSHTRIDSLPPDVSKLAQLVVLNLSHCGRLTHVPASLTKLTRLENLNLQQCGGLTSSSFPVTALPKLTSLKFFNTRGCAELWERRKRSGYLPRFTSAPRELSSTLDRLSSMTNLQKLWISSLSQESLPSSLSKLFKLRSLSVYFQKLQSFPDDLKSLVELQLLDLNSCRALVTLPSWVPDSFFKLRVLDLRLCIRLSELPELSKLQRLTKLDLSCCQALTHLPQAFFSSGAFPALQELWLMGCAKLEEVPEVQTGAVPRLLLLNLQDCCSLRQLTQSVEELVSVRDLNLSGCAGLEPFMTDDQALGGFQNLEKLSLKNTSIQQIPESVAKLPCLKRLNISGCGNVTRIPELVGHGDQYFPRLEELLAKETSINELPVALARLPRLKKVDITGCPASIFNEELREAFRSRSTPVQILGV